MGVLYDNTKPADQEIYTKALEHVKFIEDNSNDKPFELTISETSQSASLETKKIDTLKEQITPKIETVIPSKTTFNGKFLSATALSKELGISAKDLQYKFEKLKWIEKKNDVWVLTNLGMNKGAELKKGQYGEYIAYPETVIIELM